MGAKGLFHFPGFSAEDLFFLLAFEYFLLQFFSGTQCQLRQRQGVIKLPHTDSSTSIISDFAFPFAMYFKATYKYCVLFCSDITKTN